MPNPYVERNQKLKEMDTASMTLDEIAESFAISRKYAYALCTAHNIPYKLDKPQAVIESGTLYKSIVDKYSSNPSAVTNLTIRQLADMEAVSVTTAYKAMQMLKELEVEAVAVQVGG